jgi:hypothetical protein
MADKDDQIEIELDEPVEKTSDDDIKIEKAEEEPKRGREIEPEEGLEVLKGRLEQERQGRLEAERRAAEFSETAYRARTEVQDSNLHLVNNAIDSVRQTNEVLKANYRDSMANGDYDSAAEVQSAMAANAAKLLQLEQGKTALENQSVEPAPAPYRHTDPVEEFTSQLSYKSAQWVRRHPEFVTDQRLNNKMIAAHNLVMADGIEPDTDDYFDAIEDVLKISRREEPEAKQPQRRSSPAAAPVSRSGTGTGSRPNVVRLTAAEREMATMMGQTEQEYARNKVALIKEGKMN